MLTVFIDNNAWDVFFLEDLDLEAELPRDEFYLTITREAEFELSKTPLKIREYAENQIEKRDIETDTYFGFLDECLPLDEQRVGGFGELGEPGYGGRLAELDEASYIEREQSSVGPGKRPTGLFRNEADVSLAARSLHSVVLTCDTKKVLKRVATLHQGLVVDLKKLKRGSSLSAFIRSEIERMGING